MLRILLILLSLLAFAFGPSMANAQTPCHLLTSASPIPGDYGAAYNVFSPANEVLLKVACDPASNTVFHIGNGEDTFYIYRIGYEWTGSRWREIALNGQRLVGDWYIGSAAVNLPRSEVQLAEGNFVVAYTCFRNGSQWKCGCREEACRTSSWQLQAFRYAPSAGGGGGSSDFIFTMGYTIDELFPGAATKKTYYYWMAGNNSGQTTVLKANGHKVLNVMPVTQSNSMITGKESVEAVSELIIKMSDVNNADGVVFDEFSLNTSGAPSNVDRFNLILKALPAVRAARPNKVFVPFLTSTGAWAKSSDAKPLRDALATGLLDYAYVEGYYNCDNNNNFYQVVDAWVTSNSNLIPKLIPIYGLNRGSDPKCPQWTPAQLDERMGYLLKKWLPYANPPPGFGFWFKGASHIKPRESTFTTIITKHYGTYF